MTKIEVEAAERINWMSKYAQRCLRSPDFTETMDCYESDFDGLTNCDMLSGWCGEKDLTPLGAEIVRQLRAQSDEEMA